MQLSSIFNCSVCGSRSLYYIIFKPSSADRIKNLALCFTILFSNSFSLRLSGKAQSLKPRSFYRNIFGSRSFPCQLFQWGLYTFYGSCRTGVLASWRFFQARKVRAVILHEKHKNWKDSWPRHLFLKSLFPSSLFSVSHSAILTCTLVPCMSHVLRLCFHSPSSQQFLMSAGFYFMFVIHSRTVPVFPHFTYSPELRIHPGSRFAPLFLWASLHRWVLKVAHLPTRARRQLVQVSFSITALYRLWRECEVLGRSRACLHAVLGGLRTTTTQRSALCQTVSLLQWHLAFPKLSVSKSSQLCIRKQFGIWGYFYYA